jgi:hypothetical protein
MSDYKRMLRDIVRDQGAPESFRANAVRLSDEQLAIALREYDDALPEVAVDIAESVAMCLRDPRNSFVQMLQAKSAYEAIGLSLVAGCRLRLTPLVRRDLELAASDMEMEDRTDAEVEHA